MKAIIIGGGSIGQRHALNLQKLGVSTRIIDIDEIDNVDNIIKCEEIFDGDQLIGLVCSPNINHIEHCLKLAEHNIPIFCEKPFYSSSKGINKLLDIINEKNLKKYLQTKNIPDPDLLIRTGNTKRLSNFLLWQLAYSEIFFVKKLWPDFNEKDYARIIMNFKKVKRNFGNI